MKNDLDFMNVLYCQFYSILVNASGFKRNVSKFVYLFIYVVGGRKTSIIHT